jgi:uncharacterized repeat protein (TIGR02543 family)
MRYTLTIAAAGDGATSPAAGSYTFDAGTAVTVTATPADGSGFAGWSGASTGIANPVTLTMDRDKTLTARFGVLRAVLIGATGAGTTSPGPGTYAYPTGAVLIVNAAPAAGATFEGWSGAATGTSDPVTIPVNGDVTLTAAFSAGVAAGSFANPVLWEDGADLDLFRVGDLFYSSSSTMHYSPGAPILRSWDLVNWEYAGHSVPVLDWSARYDLGGGNAYVKGIWASTLRYRESNQTFYWLGCIEFSKTYVYTASAVEGPWQKHPAIDDCYYDAGLLIDDDDSMYVAYGNTQISVAKLSADGLTAESTRQVFSTPAEIGTLEGARFYKIDGNYYIFLTRPANGQYVLKSTTGPFGTYELKQLLLDLGSPISGGGVPHQGSLVQLQNGDWYYMAFVDAYPGGRVPVLAPITWGADGFPILTLVDDAWGVSYPMPSVPTPPRTPRPFTGVDTFSGTTLDPEWEWNHNPDDGKWSLDGKLTLQTATVTSDLYAARNTLTHRIMGPASTATVVLDLAAMHDGDRAGLALLRDRSAWVGVRRDGGALRVAMVDGLTMSSTWATTSTGTEVESAAITGSKIWLRVSADIRPGSSRTGRFFYSTDGATFRPIGTALRLNSDWHFFMGYRFGIFNYASSALGGSVDVESFEMTSVTAR